MKFLSSTTKLYCVLFQFLSRKWMFAFLNSDINSLKSGLLRLTSQPYCKKGLISKSQIWNYKLKPEELSRWSIQQVLNLSNWMEAFGVLLFCQMSSNPPTEDYIFIDLLVQSLEWPDITLLPLSVFLLHWPKVQSLKNIYRLKSLSFSLSWGLHYKTVLYYYTIKLYYTTIL